MVLVFGEPGFALIEAVTPAVHLEDVHVMGEPGKQCACQSFWSQDFRPFFEWQVTCDECGAASVALRGQLEQQFSVGFSERYKPKFVDDQQNDFSKLVLQSKQALLSSRLHQFMHE